MNDSPRARESLSGIRRANRAFRMALGLASLPMPLILLVVVAYLAWGSLGHATTTISLAALLGGTLCIAGIAVVVAAPLALAGALASRDLLGTKHRQRLEVVLSGLSAFPMVALGFLFAQVVGPWASVHLGISGLGPAIAAAALSLGLLPVLWRRFLLAFHEVPQSLVHGALALGARPLRVLLGVELGAAWPDILRALAEGLARAAGESVIVLMVAGNSATLLGGIDGASSIGQALLIMMPEIQSGTPVWIETHRLAFVLFLVCIGFHLIGGIVRPRIPR